MDKDHVLTGRADVTRQFHHSLGTTGQKIQIYNTEQRDENTYEGIQYRTRRQKMYETEYMTQKCIH